eukprot:TRINITY_DN3542_c0_g1_i1.p1 TRINITY_DN3542_c0_g1~~TRINITY_DN3542_c0_g1_i1.p1  ORF type:complete len:569 (-),score=95.59 TRINITY_DN3542_c0_g1_i1:257-1900(-)
MTTKTVVSCRECPRDHPLELMPFSAAEHASRSASTKTKEDTHKRVKSPSASSPSSPPVLWTCAACGEPNDGDYAYRCIDCKYNVCVTCFSATPADPVPIDRATGLPRFLRPRPPRKFEIPQFWSGVYTINWLHTYILLMPLAVLLIGSRFIPLLPSTALWAGLCYTYAGLGITAGYHRLFSHCAYKASALYEILMAFCGAGALQGSIKWWARNHRVHHRYVDTNKEPYNALRGFFYCHVGWMLMNQNYDALGRVDVSDLRRNKIVQLQHKYYGVLALLSGVFLPAIIPGLFWGDWWGGVVYGFALKVLIVHHSTFFINSIAHFPLPSWFGSLQTYSDGHSTFDNWFVALLTNGEGYHNFHHEFPQDYRNGVRMWHWDPTKWLIRVAYVLGLVSDLVRFPGREIVKSRLTQRYRMHTRNAQGLLQRLDRLDHGPRPDTLPVMTRDQVYELSHRKESPRGLLIIDGLVYDYHGNVHVGSGCTHKDTRVPWYEGHPGGKRYLDAYRGTDATKAFGGTVYKHSHGAYGLLSSLVVARLPEGEAAVPAGVTA